jgi:hypothetical protein
MVRCYSFTMYDELGTNICPALSLLYICSPLKLLSIQKRGVSNVVPLVVPLRCPEPVGVNDFYAKTGVSIGAEQLRTQLSAFALDINIFLLPPVCSSSVCQTPCLSTGL